MRGGHIIIFSKEPQLGRVKTRLAKDIGPLRARTIYLKLLRGTWKAVSQVPAVRLHLAISPDGGAGKSRYWPQADSRFGQGPGDLGQRMQRALRRFAPAPTLLIGCDIAGLTPAILTDAFRKLRSADVIYGPAVDGGFWLVGCRGRGFTPSLFHDVRWSHDATLQDCLGNLPGHLKVAQAARLSDVDRQEDLAQLP